MLPNVNDAVTLILHDGSVRTGYVETVREQQIGKTAYGYPVYAVKSVTLAIGSGRFRTYTAKRIADIRIEQPSHTVGFRQFPVSRKG